MSLRHKLYYGLKVAKSNTPFVRAPRLLKREAEVSRYGDRPILDEGAGNRAIRGAVADLHAFAAGKIGDCELEALVKFERFEHDRDAFFRSISRDGHELDLLYVNTGVFPRTPAAVGDWASIFLGSLASLDMIAVWFNTGEEGIVERHAPRATLTRLRALEPYYHAEPWSASLAGRRVAVVTPFFESVRSQRRRWRGADLFPSNPIVFPDFEVEVVRSPFSAALEPPRHPDWASSLEDIKERLGRTQFDVCLVGAGAYSLPICAFVRTAMERPAVHLGGATQLLFGIRGRRWNRHPEISRLYNHAWVAPSDAERPRGTWKLEGSAYW